MSDLAITRILPNPAGKDRTPSNQTTNQQLNGEWVEFKNPTAKNLDITDVSLLHNTFNAYCHQTGSDSLITFKGILDSGWSIRVHSGKGETVSDGTVWHLFLNRANFVWNNKCGDTAVLRTKTGEVDRASYAPNPSEGEVLIRVPGTNRLEPARQHAGTYARW